MKPLFNGFTTGRQTAAAGGHLEEIGASAIDLVLEIDEAALVAGFDQHGARAVAKNDAGGSVLVIDDAGHGVGADHQHLFMGSALHQVGGGGQSINESGAGGYQIESPGSLGANLVLDQAGGGREEHVGRDGADEDGVKVRTVDSGVGQCSFGCLDGHVRRCHLRRGDVSFRNSGALHDPIVGGIHHFG